MSEIHKEMSLQSFATTVCNHLNEHNIQAILTGGAVVSIYTANKYESADADFISQASENRLIDAMKDLGFEKKGKDFVHPDTELVAEFPGRQMQVGSHGLIEDWVEMEEDGKKLYLLSPTDCVRDRLAAYFHWNDTECLGQAVMVAIDQPVNIELIRKWAIEEGARDKFDDFIKEIEAENKRKP
ncbi:MAG: hypothetical protein JKX97_00830 [Candidatus Lindowbacteria bacterium]|nr:hypothetical protein [Candidatus Lindowbacteria bacterium]